MGRVKSWRYDEPVLPAEHRALKDEFLVMLILLVVGIVCVAAEPLMDLFMAALGVR